MPAERAPGRRPDAAVAGDERSTWRLAAGPGAADCNATTRALADVASPITIAQDRCCTSNVRLCQYYEEIMATNITLRLDEKIISRIKHLAVDQETSVSAWVGELVTRAVEEMDGFQPARKRALRAMTKPVRVPDASALTRDESHER